VFRRYFQAGEFSSQEDVSISCFGRSPQILRELLDKCYTKYTKLIQGKTCLYEHQDGTWIRSAVSKIRRMSTVILNKSRKKELLKDIRDFLNPASQQWYSDRNTPYRWGYLLYGPPGTGKSSLSLAIAGYFGLNIYILSLSTINKASLKSLFDKLSSRCIILLEDINAVSSNQDAKTENSRQIVTGSPSQQSKSASRKVSLSALLNVINSVGSQEGQILIITTNHIIRLNEALIRPGRVDKKIELGLADNKITVDLFCLIFKLVQKDVALPKDARPEDNTKVHKAAVS
jgi:chaperone BCS1